MAHSALPLCTATESERAFTSSVVAEQAGAHILFYSVRAYVYIRTISITAHTAHTFAEHANRFSRVHTHELRQHI